MCTGHYNILRMYVCMYVCMYGTNGVKVLKQCLSSLPNQTFTFNYMTFSVLMFLTAHQEGHLACRITAAATSRGFLCRQDIA